MLLNISVFMWFGAVAPWTMFRVNDVIPLYRLIPLGIMILLFRRVPMVMLVHKKIPQIEEFQQALFVGFFGPIGVSAIFYLYISIDFLNHVTVDGEIRGDAAQLKDVMLVVIWFLAICSIVVHGLSVPIGKLGYHLPRTMSNALNASQENAEEPHFLHHPGGNRPGNSYQMRKKRKTERQPSAGAFRIGGSVIPSERTGVEIESPAEPNRPIRFLATGQNTPTASGSRTPTEQDAAANEWKSADGTERNESEGTERHESDEAKRAEQEAVKTE